MTATQFEMSSSISFYFNSATIRRGEAYLREGRVSPLVCAGNVVRAIVAGSEDYEVCVRGELDSVGWLTLIVTCSCPYCEEHGCCKHIWATILKIERSEEAANKLGVDLAEEIELEVGDVDDFADIDLDDFGEFDQSDDPPIPHVDASAAAGLRDSPRANRKRVKWKTQIQSIARSMETRDQSRQNVDAGESEYRYAIDLRDMLMGSGNLAIDLYHRQRKRDGQWGKPQPRSVNIWDIPRLLDPDDRRILSLLQGLGDRYSYGYGGNRMKVSCCEVPLDLQQTLVEMIARTGRAALVRPDGARGEGVEQHVEWDDQGEWRLKLAVEPETDEVDSYVIRGAFERNGETLAMDEPVLLTAGGLIFIDNKIARLDDGGGFPWVVVLRESGEVHVPAGEIDDLLETVHTMPRLPDLKLPDELAVERVVGKPAPRLRVDRPKSAIRMDLGKTELRAELSFDYEGNVIDESNPAPGWFDRMQRRFIERDVELEEAARMRLGELGFRTRQNRYEHRSSANLVIARRNLANAVNTLVSENWRVEAEGALYRSSGSIRFEMRGSGIDWFELEGDATFDDQVATLPELLKAIRKGEKYVRLDDGTFGLLPDEWVNRYARIAELSRTDEVGRTTLRPTQISLIDVLLEQLPEVEFDQHVARARRKLNKFTKVRPRKAPRGFRGELRPYQKDGLGWMHFLREIGFGGCLADDMGLGKTVQVLALLELRRQQRKRDKGTTPPSLVVVPRSLLHNWRAEAARFTPFMRVLDHVGSDRHRPSEGGEMLAAPHELTSDAINHFDDYDLILTTYGTMRRDINALKDVTFDYLILDESQAIKNASTASAKASRLLCAGHRLALSGTPIENHLGELWSLFEFLNPGMLGPDERWVSRIANSNSARTDGHTDIVSGKDQIADESENSEYDLLARAIRPFVFRRTKQQVAGDLPEKSEQTLYCELKPKQRTLYNELRDHYRGSLMSKIESAGLGRSKIMVLEALLRLRQAACHPGLIDDRFADSPSAKLDALLSQLTDVIEEDHKALVFSQFTSFLAMVRTKLDSAGVRYAYLDGRTRKRADRVREFQEDPDCRLFLISLKAGGLGLNLTAAEYVFLLDPWWNPAVEAQAVDRAHRIGQTRPVFAYRLIACDTVEEKVLELQKSKQALADAIIRADANLIRSLTVDDLRILLS